MSVHQALKQKRNEILNIATRYGARKVRVFGSTLKGKENRGSDIDFLVEMSPSCSLLDIIALKQDIEDLLDRNVDVVSEAAISPYFRDEILREAVNL
jgi:predicted nucleotidyltransferase